MSTVYIVQLTCKDANGVTSFPTRVFTTHRAAAQFVEEGKIMFANASFKDPGVVKYFTIFEKEIDE